MEKNEKQRRNYLRPVVKYTEGLPILEQREKILSLIHSSQVVIVAGETGSGKTTQLPVFCLEAGRGVNGKIGCTQPRRIAATSIAARVADELGCTLGLEVGYKIRFGDMDRVDTAVKFMTDGILLAEIENDPQLRMYDTLIIDEAHERSLNIDFILGYLRTLVKLRKDLKVIISSATIDTTLFSKAFDNAPVIEVSGRMYPVEVLYLDPSLDADDEEKEDIDYINAAVRSVRDISDMYGTGDILIFMPTERDIRETCDKLHGMRMNETDILPLFSRLSRGEQDLIFRNTGRRKIVIATNIAETSITVPGIQYVIDTGLARISRYIPRLRTNRLPIEPVSRAAAKQRMGRCGRVMDGVCIRLYSQKELDERDEYTLPEIKRSNLAGVLLSMIAHRLGSIEEFPFLEPPSKQAISEAYSQLRELGALDESNVITHLGREMAELPLDPHIARMVFAAQKEGALREVKIIASALSIVDPLERPFDKQAEADAMHKKFRDTASDFLLYVKLWDAFQNEWKTLKTQNKMRKFCKDHFLSYVRMQEWHDVHKQLSDTLNRIRKYSENTQEATYDGIHRALLTGLLTNCAVKNDQGRYSAARGREVLIFPGSVLANKKVDWVMCHEIVETSQVFARTVAVVNPKWLEELGAHLCSRSYTEPYFDIESGSVKANETVSLLGLPVATHNGIRYGRVNQTKATEVFIWKGLVEEQLTCFHKFFQHNKNTRKEIERMEAKLRTRSLFAGEQAIYDFYKSRITGVSSLHDLNRFIKEHGDDQFLFMSKEDLLTDVIDEKTFSMPDSVSIGSKSYPLKYNFSPGAESDGVTMRIPAREAPFISRASLGWMLPHLWAERVMELLQSLPKETRKKLMPLSEKTREIVADLKVSRESFNSSVGKTVKKLYGIDVIFDLSNERKIAQHLLLRVEVCNDKGEVIASGRDESVLSIDTMQQATAHDSAWEVAARRYELYGLTKWSVGDIPEFCEIASNDKGVPLYGYPALCAGAQSAALKMVRSSEEAAQMHEAGFKCLLGIVLAPEFLWIEHELRFSPQLKLLCAPFGGVENVKHQLLLSVKSYLLDIPQEPYPRTQKEFDAALGAVRKQSTGTGYEALSLIEKILGQYTDCLCRISKESRSSLGSIKAELKTDLVNLIEAFTKKTLSFDILRQYPRYLKAFGYRIERAYNEPFKYREKRTLLAIYSKKIDDCIKKTDRSKQKEIQLLLSMYQEFVISTFAQQEVRTLFPVSEKRIDKKIDELR